MRVIAWVKFSCRWNFKFESMSIDMVLSYDQLVKKIEAVITVVTNFRDSIGKKIFYENCSACFLDLGFGLLFLLFFLLSTGASRQPVFLAMCVSISASNSSSSLATLSTSPRINRCSVIKAFLVRSKSVHNIE